MYWQRGGIQRRTWGAISLFGVAAAVIITLGLSIKAQPAQARPAEEDSALDSSAILRQGSGTPTATNAPPILCFTITPTWTPPYLEGAPGFQQAQLDAPELCVSATPSRTPVPTTAPSLTLPPSMTPTITRTLPPTPTPTTTLTALPTQPAACSLVTFDSARLIDNNLEIAVRNANPTAPVFISHVEIPWATHPSFPGMYADDMRVVGRTRFWFGPDYTPPTVADTADPNWYDDSPTYFLRRFDANAVTLLRIRFANGPATLANYFGINTFAGAKLYFSTVYGGLAYDPAHDCVVEVPPAAPTPTPSTSPTLSQTPVLTCSDFTFTFGSFETNGVMRFRIANAASYPVSITGFRLNWARSGIAPASPVDFAAVGGTTAFDAAAVVIWDGSSYNSPVVSSEPTWQTSAVIEGGQSRDVWFDFDGTSGRLDSNLGYVRSDFNGSTLTINDQCEITIVPSPPPTATPTPGPSLTPLPSLTPTPTPSRTPSITTTPFPTRDVDPCHYSVSAGDVNGLILAIQAANTTVEPDTICLQAGLYAFTSGPFSAEGPNALPNILHPLTILGGGAIFQRQAAEAFRFFHVEPAGSLTLDHLSLMDGRSSNATYPIGGAILSNGPLTVTNSLVANNIANYAGGGIYSFQSSLTVQNSTFSGNVALQNYGGAIDSPMGGPVLVEDSVITENQAVGGGGIAVCGCGWGNRLTLRRSQITHNLATGHGGGLRLSSVTPVLIEDSLIASNTAYGDGGAIQVLGSSQDPGSRQLTLDGGTIVRDNRAYEHGGGITAWWAVVTVQNGSQVIFNRADLGGGGLQIRSSASLVVQTGSQISYNQSASGGAVYVDWSGSVAISDSRIEGNTAANGASFFSTANAGQVSVQNSCLLNNTSGWANALSPLPAHAANNWWGAADGPSGAGPGSGDPVSANVEFDPFLTAALPGCGEPPVPTATYTPSRTPAPATLTPSRTPTPDATLTSTPSATPTLTPTVTLTPTATITPLPTRSDDPCNYTVGAGDVAVLRGSIEAANVDPDPDTICLTESVYALPDGPYAADGANALPDITGAVTLLGRRATLRRTEMGDYRLLHVARTGSLTLKDVFLEYGLAYDGGGIYAAGSLILDNARVRWSTAYHNGGGIYADHALITLRGSSAVAGNSALNWGGGIYNGNGSWLNLEANAQIDQNEALGDFGGGIFNAQMSGAMINDAIFIGNNAKTLGGGIYNEGLVVEVHTSCFQENSPYGAYQDTENSPSLIIATTNFWGAVDGPSGVAPGTGDAISTGVIYDPFVTDAGQACFRGTGLPTVTPSGPPTLVLPTLTASRTPGPSLTPSPTPSQIVLPSETPSITPTLTAADYTFSFVDFQPNGVAHYRLANDGPVPVIVSGFALEWAHEPSAAPLTSVSVGGVNAFDPAGVLIWQGSDMESPTTATSGRVPGWRTAADYDPGWLAEVVIQPGQVQDLWFDFDGTTGRLDLDLGYGLVDLAGSTLAIAEVGDIEVNPTSTPLPTNTPIPTFTPSWTPPATHTPWPSMTFTPSKTPVLSTSTPSPGPTPSSTPLPSPTSSPSMTHTPTNSPAPTLTYTPGITSTPGPGCVPLHDAAGTILCTSP